MPRRGRVLPRVIVAIVDEVAAPQIPQKILSSDACL